MECPYQLRGIHPVDKTVFGPDGVPVHWKPGYDHTGPYWRAYDKSRNAKTTSRTGDTYVGASLEKKR